MEITGLRIHITGIVQGVGFRPFVYSLAKRLELTGWVRNTSAGVDIEVDGSSKLLDEFTNALKTELPPLARIDELMIESKSPDGYTTFEIVHSESIPDAFQPISPDVCICADCLRELSDPNDRRYRYPFINCTNCGPRFTIIQDIPYDRPKTTMAGFELCQDCAREYDDPLNRRFHAQPVACPRCGPQIWLEHVDRMSTAIEGTNESEISGDAALRAVQDLISHGKIVAIKGIGGFHLACDALNPQAVSELRTRKLRVDKPFALMMPDLSTVERHCYVSKEEQLLLESHPRPIVILKRRPESTIDETVAPRQDTLGVMLPYTPLHYLLFAHAESGEGANINTNYYPLSVLVMTSGNLREEPIAYSNEEARQRLGILADAFLMNNRPIHIRCDDSLVRVISTKESRITPAEISNHAKDTGEIPIEQGLLHLRRARGYAPHPIRLGWESPPILATGPELKNTFCIARGSYAFLSHHVGDIENYETLKSFEEGITHYERLFRVAPRVIAYDTHPNYLATRYALDRAETHGLYAIGVQHHHAHIAACMAENGLPGDTPIIGVAFDGTGYGTDGAIWGGEFLIADYQGFRRAGHLEYFPLPGGDAAIRKPARTALAYLWQAGIPWDMEISPVQAMCAEERTALRSQLEHNINSPKTSSMGRLFDAVAALSGVRQSVNYEAQAAIEFEMLVDPVETGYYPFEIRGLYIADNDQLQEGRDVSSIDLPLTISTHMMLQALLADVHASVATPIIAARFHNGVAQMILDICRILRSEYGIVDVALSGGVWQNTTLLIKARTLLFHDGFNLYTHHQVPPNDGGISLGQVAVAAHSLQN